MWGKIFYFIALAFGFINCSSPKKPSDKAKSTDKKPNIFIAADMYPEMFNCLPKGKRQNLTLNIDKLASEGVLKASEKLFGISELLVY